MKKAIVATSVLTLALALSACGPKHDRSRMQKPKAEPTATKTTEPSSVTPPKPVVANSSTPSSPPPPGVNTPPSAVEENATSWVDRELTRIDSQLDLNPNANREYLPKLQQIILQKAGFNLRCDSEFKSYETKLCYTAIKALLNAIKSGLAPSNPQDGFPISEIVIVKTPSKLYEPAEKRFHLEVNHMITAQEWPSFLRREIEGFARQNEVYRLSQVNAKEAAIIAGLYLKTTIDVPDTSFNKYEKGIHLLEQVLLLEEQLRAASPFAKDESALKGKAYERIRIAGENRDIFEDSGKFMVAISAHLISPRDALLHLAKQPNAANQPLTKWQQSLLNGRIDNNYETKTAVLAEVTSMREKVSLLVKEIETNMLKGRVKITINLTAKWRFKNVLMGLMKIPAQNDLTTPLAYQFLMNLREALSGGNLENMQIQEIRVENSAANIKVYTKDSFVAFKAEASAKEIYDGLWATTPAGEAFYAEKLKMMQSSRVY